MASIALQHRAEILARVARGEALQLIGKDFGICGSTISMALKDDTEYASSIESSWQTRLDNALQAVIDAGDDLNVARAREISLRHIEWRAEREVASRWGAKQQLQVEHKVGVPAELLDVATKLLELRAGQGERSRICDYVKESCDAAEAEIVAQSPHSDHDAPALPAPGDDKER